MIYFNGKNDFDHKNIISTVRYSMFQIKSHAKSVAMWKAVVHDQHFNHFAAKLLQPNVTSKILSELAGIKTAAIRGARLP